MSDTLADLATCLPSEFLSGDMDDKPCFLRCHNHFHVPNDFASSSSTESESDDDDLAGLTRRFTRSVSLQERLKIPYPLEKKRVFSGSPESTLNWNVYGPTQVRSSPTTPFGQANGNSLDLIYAAAEQVARMKMKTKTNAVNDAVFANRGLLKPPLSHHHFPPNRSICNENEEFLRQQLFRRRVAGDCGGRCGTGGPVGFRQSAWPPVPFENQRRQQPPNLSVGGFTGRGVAVVKKERAGTGVFLPRNYCNAPPESKKKPACCPQHLPAGMSQSSVKHVDPIIAPPQPNIRGGFAPPYQVPPPPLHFKRDEIAELLTARRNAVMLAQQRRSTTLAGVPETRMGPPEVVLPQEWTY